MSTILNVTIPFFAVIGCGYLASKLGLISRAGREGLNGFVFHFALPVLLFSVMSGAKLTEEFEWIFVAAYSLVSIVLFFMAFGIGRFVFKLDTAPGALHALSCVYGNIGYVGIPLIIVAFGQDASVPVIVCLTVDLVLMIPLAMVFMEARTGAETERSHPFHAPLKTIRGLVRNPVILSIVAGIIVSVTGVKLPHLVIGTTDLLGMAAAPCALFALGSSLYGQPVRGALREVGAMTLTKLVVHPLLVWYAMFELFDITPLWGLAAVVAASMPVAATVFVLAQQYNAYVVRASTVIALSTAVSLITITLLLTWLPDGELITLTVK